MTSDESQSIIPFSCYLNKKYFPESDIYILGYTDVKYNLPEKCYFIELNKGNKRNINNWFMDICNYLNTINDEYIIFTVDDNPLTDYININDINYTINKLKNNKNIGLLWGGGYGYSNKNVSYLDKNEIIFDSVINNTGARHYTSLRMGIWKKEVLIEVLKNSNNKCSNFELNNKNLFSKYDLLYFYKNNDSQNIHSYKNYLLPDTEYTLYTERFQPNNMINCMCIKNIDVKNGLKKKLICKEKICYTPDTRFFNIDYSIFINIDFDIEKWYNYCKKNNYNSFLEESNGSVPLELIYNDFKKYRNNEFYYLK